MSEPTSAAVAVGTVTMFGLAGASTALPQMADIALICSCAIAGGAVQLSTITTKSGEPYSKVQAAIYLIVTAGMAIALTSFLAYVIERAVGLPHVMTGAPIAFLIGARREWVLSKVVGSVDKATGGEK
jgi:hypothetical protein